MSAPLDVTFDGMALNDSGFLPGNLAFSGLALNTFGFIIGASEIWTKEAYGVTTIWTIEYLPN